MADNAKLTIGDQSIELPVTVGSEDEVGIDISKLRSATGAVTLDAGFANTAPCVSDITYLDGEKGVLRYRGYPIEQLAERSGFVEVAYLLLYGELPTAAELAAFRDETAGDRDVPEGMGQIFDGFPTTGHPMAMLSAATAALSSFEPGDRRREPAAMDRSIRQLFAKLPTMGAMAYRRTHELPYVAPDPSLGYAANLLRMMFADASGAYEVDADLARTVDVLLTLHADHEQNCSTSTVRFVGSSHANLQASISAGISALWGPLHGGANQKVLEMLERVRQDGGDLARYVAMAKDKDNPFRLMGFGHRVYKNFDPRATILKEQCAVVLERLGIEDPLLDIAKRLERVALEDPYFVDRKLYPNVDFYSGILYRALGIPTNMFTVMFAVGRLPGWMANWREMNEQRSRIGRPRQVYTGSTERDYVAVEDRAAPDAE